MAAAAWHNSRESTALLADTGCSVRTHTQGTFRCVLGSTVWELHARAHSTETVKVQTPRHACGHSVRSRHQLKVANDSGLLTTVPLAESMPDEVRGGHHERR